MSKVLEQVEQSVARRHQNVEQLEFEVEFLERTEDGTTRSHDDAKLYFEFCQHIDKCVQQRQAEIRELRAIIKRNT